MAFFGDWDGDGDNDFDDDLIELGLLAIAEEEARNQSSGNNNSGGGCCLFCFILMITPIVGIFALVGSLIV